MKYTKELNAILKASSQATQAATFSYIKETELLATTITFILETEDIVKPKIKDLFLNKSKEDWMKEVFDNFNPTIKVDSDLEEHDGVLLGKEASNVLEIAECEARLCGKSEVDVIHLLLGFAKNNGDAQKILENNNINYNSLIKLASVTKKPKLKTKGGDSKSNSPGDQLKSLFSSLGINIIPMGISGGNPDKDEDSDDPFESAFDGFGMNDNDDEKDGKSSFKFLDKYAKNLNKLAEEDKFDPIHGRETEIDLLIKYLGCKKKNNVVLLGDPGVGKTTIIEGLTQRIIKGQVPEFLKSKIIYSLDLNALVAGTKYRGQYEERLQGIIKEVTKNKNIIVFIDEFHNLIGNGSSDGNGDASNVLKPYLARGEFQCIGSTTFGEYRKFVEKDGALKRRFNNIPIYEPDSNECFEILKTIKNRYEEHHGVTYSDNILKLCVDLSQRYITDRFLPDKAIDILDLSGSETKLNTSNDPLRTRLDEIKTLKREAIIDERFEDCIELKKEETSILGQISDNPNEVTKETVYSAISKICGVPVDNIGKSDMAKLRGMKSILESVVVGQDNAIKTILGALQKNSLGLRDPKKPIASILCVGPSGTGKTHICKQIAKEFFGSEDNLIRFDMNEYTEKHEITKLIGASASYVGYDDEPLFYKIKRKPYSVVLFDEIEKADPGIFPILLNIFDEGYVTAANGTVIDFKNTIIVLTGNIGTKDIMTNGVAIGFNGGNVDQNSRNNEIILKAIKKTFSPEFINRLSQTVYFNKLTDEDLNKICDIEIKKLESRIQEKGYKSLLVSPEVKTTIIKGCDLDYGARDLQREISKHIEESICNYLLENDVPENLKDISITKSGDNIVVEFK